MRNTITPFLVAAIALAVPVASPGAQSVLDRPDNISSDWVGSTGTLYFNFVHRFSVSAPPERKVSNFPTFLIATGFASRALIGVDYATNSDLAARYPNEYEFFARYAPIQQEEGAPLDLGGQIDYNLAVKGVDGELSVARREGPLRLVAVGRAIADTLGGSTTRFAYGAGGTLRFGRFLALAGDASSLAHRTGGERIAWSAGVHIALPNTPHTLSLHVSNASTSTLQGLARGGDVRRYGFEFTIPVHLSRFFSDATVVPTAAPTGMASADTTVQPAAAEAAAPAKAVAAAPVPSAPGAAAKPSAAADTNAAKPTEQRAARAPARATAPATRPAARPATSSKVFNARMKNQAFIPSNIEIEAGTTVHWKNLDALIHTVTAVDKSFDSGVIAADGSYSHTFTKPGTYPIYCAAHPFMKATITVK